MMSKYGSAGNQISYGLWRRAGTNLIGFGISNDDAAVVLVDNITVPVVSNWYFVVGRFTPSAEVACFINNTSTTLAAGIPASIFNSTSPFEIGRLDALYDLDGRASLCFISANALPDALIGMLFNQSRVLFGV